jgi:aminoglycoside 3-N-acetyltransferase I
MIMEIKKLSTQDTNEFIALIHIFKEVFENDDTIPNRHHLNRLLSNPNFLVFVAINDGVVIGGLTVYVLHQYYSEKPLAYIYDVGVAPSFQGQGIGKSLILAVCTYCKENGFEDAYVEAEFEDVNAVNFYRKTNFTGELQAVHFTYSF